MSSNVVRFPAEKTKKHKQDLAESALKSDPNYKFIYDLLTAVSEVGLPIDGTPEQKAREVYAQCQRENVFAELEMEMKQKNKD